MLWFGVLVEDTGMVVVGADNMVDKQDRGCMAKVDMGCRRASVAQQ